MIGLPYVFSPVQDENPDLLLRSWLVTLCLHSTSAPPLDDLYACETQLIAPEHGTGSSSKAKPYLPLVRAPRFITNNHNDSSYFHDETCAQYFQIEGAALPDGSPRAFASASPASSHVLKPVAIDLTPELGFFHQRSQESCDSDLAAHASLNVILPSSKEICTSGRRQKRMQRSMQEESQKSSDDQWLLQKLESSDNASGLQRTTFQRQPDEADCEGMMLLYLAVSRMHTGVVWLLLPNERSLSPFNAHALLTEIELLLNKGAIVEVKVRGYGTDMTFDLLLDTYGQRKSETNLCTRNVQVLSPSHYSKARDDHSPSLSVIKTVKVLTENLIRWNGHESINATKAFVSIMSRRRDEGNDKFQVKRQMATRDAMLRAQEGFEIGSPKSTIAAIDKADTATIVISVVREVAQKVAAQAKEKQQMKTIDSTTNLFPESLEHASDACTCADDKSGVCQDGEDNSDSCKFADEDSSACDDSLDACKNADGNCMGDHYEGADDCVETSSGVKSFTKTFTHYQQRQSISDAMSSQLHMVVLLFCSSLFSKLHPIQWMFYYLVDVMQFHSPSTMTQMGYEDCNQGSYSTKIFFYVLHEAKDNTMKITILKSDLDPG